MTSTITWFPNDQLVATTLYLRMTYEVVWNLLCIQAIEYDMYSCIRIPAYRFWKSLNKRQELFPINQSTNQSTYQPASQQASPASPATNQPAATAAPAASCVIFGAPYHGFPDLWLLLGEHLKVTKVGDGMATDGCWLVQCLERIGWRFDTKGW